MGDNPFISIIIVCYNYAHLLPRALEAIREQSFHDFEIVFVDNGCTDDSLKVMQTFSNANPDIQVHYVIIEHNEGLPHGDLMGAEAACGKYLMFHDADDWMDNDTLQLLAEAASANDADRVISAFRDVDDKGNVTQVQTLGERPVHWLYGMQQASLFRTSLYREHRIRTGTLWVDAEKSFKFSRFIRKTAYVFKPCYNYLVHTDSTSRNREIYKKLFTDPQYSFDALLSTYKPYLPPAEDEEYRYAVYQLTRLYFSYILQFLRDAPLRVKLKDYSILHRTMHREVPNYLKQTRIALRNKKAVRSYARKVALLLSGLETCHLMPLGLIGYHVASKFFYFKV